MPTKSSPTSEKRATISELPEEERPRERLLSKGADTLSLTELIAILLSTGTRGKSALCLAEELLFRFHGLEGLLDASLDELIEIKGIGRAKAIGLKAAFAIASRGKQLGKQEKAPLDTPEAVYHLLGSEIAKEKQEVLAVVLCDSKRKFLLWEIVSVGTLTQVLVHPREVFYPAVRHKAAALYVLHNHPSGDPTPSLADITLTRNLIAAAKVMRIELIDHLIVTDCDFVSLKRHGVWRLSP